jgi:DNA-binding NarL/FixJ family response regulator
MASEGPTNPQIAQALFVSTKTVEVHLSSVYRKLKIARARSFPRRSPAEPVPDPPRVGVAPAKH